MVNEAIVQKTIKLANILKKSNTQSILLTTKQEDFISSYVAELFNIEKKNSNYFWATQASTTKKISANVKRSDLIQINTSKNIIETHVEAKYLMNFDFSENENNARKEILKAYSQLKNKDEIKNNIILLYVVHFPYKLYKKIIESNSLYIKDVSAFTYLNKSRNKKYHNARFANTNKHFSDAHNGDYYSFVKKMLIEEIKLNKNNISIYIEEINMPLPEKCTNLILGSIAEKFEFKFKVISLKLQ